MKLPTTISELTMEHLEYIVNQCRKEAKYPPLEHTVPMTHDEVIDGCTRFSHLFTTNNRWVQVHGVEICFPVPYDYVLTHMMCSTQYGMGIM